MSKGFTLIEFLVAAIITGLLALGVFTTLPRLKKENDLNSAVQAAASLLTEARARTLSSENAAQFGINFASSVITLFKGSVFNPSDISNRAIIFPVSVEVSCISLAGGASSTVFTRLTGETAQYGFVNFRLRSDIEKTNTVAITETGSVLIYEIDDDSVGYWDFNDGTGTVARDRAKGASDGVLTNISSPYGWTSGKMCGAISFDGANDYVLVPASNLDLTGDITVSMWVRPAVSSNSFHASWNYFIYHKDPGLSNTFKQELGYYNDDGPRFKPYNQSGTDYDFSPDVVFNAGTWYHVVYIRRGTSLEIYINGALADSRNDFSGTLRLTGPGGEVRIGGGTGSSSGFIGAMDEVRIYKRALNTDEITSLYQVGI